MDEKVIKFATSHGIFEALSYGAAEETCVFEPQAKECGYERITTFFSDMSIAEWYGLAEVRESYNRIVKSWLSDYKFFTEFVLVLNWKSWEWAMYGGRKYEELSKLYVELFEDARDKFYKHYSENKEATSYFFRVTD